MTTIAVEPFIFDHNADSAFLTEIDGAPSEAGAEWADVWKYQLPPGFCYYFNRESVFMALLKYLSDPVDAFFLSDNGVFTDETTDARDVGTGDVDFVPATPVAAEDFIYIGYRYKFQAVSIVMGTAGTDSVIVWDWEYLESGTTWVNLPGISANAQTWDTDAAGTHTITWTVPDPWSKGDVNGHNMYWIRIGITTMTTDFTIEPVGSQILAHGATPEIANNNMVRLVWTDPNEESSWRLMGAVRYQMVREFQQESKFHHMDIGDEIRIPEHYRVKIQVKALAPIDASESAFGITCTRSRLSIFG